MVSVIVAIWDYLLQGGSTKLQTLPFDIQWFYSWLLQLSEGAQQRTIFDPGVGDPWLDVDQTSTLQLQLLTQMHSPPLHPGLPPLHPLVLHHPGQVHHLLLEPHRPQLHLLLLLPLWTLIGPLLPKHGYHPKVFFLIIPPFKFSKHIFHQRWNDSIPQWARTSWAEINSGNSGAPSSQHHLLHLPHLHQVGQQACLKAIKHRDRLLNPIFEEACVLTTS